MRISPKERRILFSVIISSCLIDFFDLIVKWNHSSCHQLSSLSHHLPYPLTRHLYQCHPSQSCYLQSLHLSHHRYHHHPHHHHPLWSVFGGVDGLALAFSTGNPSVDDQTRPNPHHTSSDSWALEELWPKEKSLIHIKLIKPVPKEIPIRESRTLDSYLTDLSLDFDSPYRSLYVNNCAISFKSYYDGFASEPSNQEMIRDTSNIQVQISGGLACKELPLSLLTVFSANLTHLAVRDTGITHLTKFLFGAKRLDKLIRLDIIDNPLLTSLQTRAFDGLTRLSYLSLINNHLLTEIALESFAGLKSLEELIFIGNGHSAWDQRYFVSILKSASDKILPNLIHLHLSGRTQMTNQPQHFENPKTLSLVNVNNSDPDTAVSSSHGNSKETHLESSPSLNVSEAGESFSHILSGTEYIASNKWKQENKSFDKRNNHQRKSGLKINKDDLERLTQLRYLQLNHCDLAYIHPSALAPLMKNMISLNLASNPKLRIDNLKSILAPFYVSNVKQFRSELEASMMNTSFPGSPVNQGQPFRIGLETLDLSNSITTNFVPKDLLTVISKTTITELYLASVSWTLLRESDLPPMPNLKILHIDYSLISTVEEKAFEGLEELTKLSLRGNLIQEIPLYLLEPLRKLEYLDLSGYQVNLKYLSSINDSNRAGKTILSHSKFDDDDDGRSNNLNSISRYTPLIIPRKAFVHRTSLKELNLSYKNLTQLPRYLFIGLIKLEKLHLRGCNLQNIEYLTFFPLKSIVYIDLSENGQLISNVRSSEEDTFVGLEAVEMIRLNNCNLTSEDINDFNIWRRMHEHVQLLDLSHNSIDLINSSTLQNFVELRHINLSHNQIKSWHNYTIFGKNSFITTLDLSFNQVTHISAEMLGDFRNLKNLSFAFNPLHCECDWDGPLLLLDQKQKKLNQVHHAKIQDHIQQLVHRQQEIVSTAFASSQAPPKSIIEWLNTTSIHFLHDHHPLRSNRHYFCHFKSPHEPPIVFKKFFTSDCPILSSTRNSARISVGLLMITVCVTLLLAVFLLIIAFIYNSTIRNLLTMVDDDFLHSYQYDAFVSYNVNDSDWVFNILLPSLEDLPSSEDHGFESGLSSVKFSSSHLSTISSSLFNQPSSSSTTTSTSSSAKNHVKLCVYDRDFIAGRPISECITESIRNSRKVILVISNHFAQSPWCRFETDLAHNTLMDQNRDGLILIKLEEMSSEGLEKVAPQLHFLLKTRIYLTWSEDLHEQEIFWKKLRRALGFNKPYGTVKQYYKNYVGGLTKDLTCRSSAIDLTETSKNASSVQTNKEEIHVSFTRKTLSASRDINDLDDGSNGNNNGSNHNITISDRDSGIAVVVDDYVSGVSMNEEGDDEGEDPSRDGFIVDQSCINMIVPEEDKAHDEHVKNGDDEGGPKDSNKQNNLDQETKKQSNERGDKPEKVQTLNLVVESGSHHHHNRNDQHDVHVNGNDLSENENLQESERFVTLDLGS